MANLDRLRQAEELGRMKFTGMAAQNSTLDGFSGTPNFERLRQSEELGRMKNLGTMSATSRITDLPSTSVTPNATPATPVVDVTPVKPKPTLDSINQPMIGVADDQLEQAKQAQQAGIDREKTELQARLSEIEKQQRAVFAPQFEVARRGQERSLETARRGASFRGFGRSSDALDTESELNDLALMQEAAIAAQQSAAINLSQAAARGASEDTLKGLRDNVVAAQATSDELKAELAEKQAGLTAAQVEAGQQAESDRLKLRADTLEAAGLIEDPDTGERVSTLKDRALQLDAQIAEGKQEVAEGELMLKAGELDIKQAKLPFELQKLQADIKKSLAETAKKLRVPSSSVSGFLKDNNRVLLANEIISRVKKDNLSFIQAADTLEGYGTADRRKMVNDALTLNGMGLSADAKGQSIIIGNDGSVSFVPKAKTPPAPPISPTQSAGQSVGKGALETPILLPGFQGKNIKQIGSGASGAAGTAFDFIKGIGQGLNQ